ncbi:L-seryl-tRNA(Sec) selenium transferase [Euzebya tangerina]|uniref:L-seryl-tRNA(Sec) selenium transferase n=1 Tax=Euzebya tangerina TaxID=591198 RepID=UPI000E311684|nr:L-seryl-tRNA(Sec) selenium transferase [Euzebya tangerina]
MDQRALANLPRMDVLLADAAALVERHGQAPTKDALAAATTAAREQLLAGGLSADRDELTAWIRGRAAEALADDSRPGPRRVINAAGVVVHTNLGRAPLAEEVVAAIVGATGYCDLEYELASGARGSRGTHVDALLAELVGAEDGVVVNNCASALVLVLATFAAGRQVPVSRGHLVEIGGSFRLPEIMEASGAQLREVGTTNRTRARDYGVEGDTALVLTVHPSNFTQAGFVTQPPLSAVAEVARSVGVPLVHDAGSGLLVPAEEGPLAGEVSMAEALADGADLVLASGDKLLGGPQAGLIAGRGDLIQQLRSAPLMRALRLDKLRLAGLRAALLAHRRDGHSAVQSTLATDPELPARVERLATRLDGRVVEVTTMIGGGSAPGVGVPSPAVALPDPKGELADSLRLGDPPVVVRVNEGRALIDLRTVTPADDDVIAAAVEAATTAS